jgi:hypothetical protein
MSTLDPRRVSADDAGALPELRATLAARFARHPERHPGIAWAEVLARLDAHADAWRVLANMERTGGEPDVIARDAPTGELLFVDCAPESPAGRRSVCYDRAGLESRKEHPPAHSAVEMAESLGVTLLTESDYALLQSRGDFDTRTSSWLRTPPAVRALGGALFGDRRYGRVFTYHNGAQSYYAARGFRGLLRV